MAYKNQNYMTNYKIKEEIDKLQKDYVEPNNEETPSPGTETPSPGTETPPEVNNNPETPENNTPENTGNDNPEETPNTDNNQEPLDEGE